MSVLSDVWLLAFPTPPDHQYSLVCTEVETTRVIPSFGIFRQSLTSIENPPFSARRSPLSRDQRGQVFRPGLCLKFQVSVIFDFRSFCTGPAPVLRYSSRGGRGRQLASHPRIISPVTKKKAFHFVASPFREIPIFSSPFPETTIFSTPLPETTIFFQSPGLIFFSSHLPGSQYFFQPFP